MEQLTSNQVYPQVKTS